MKYYIDKNDTSKPAYLLLYEALRDDIVRGIYPSGVRLPSKRVLAEECGVSVITVEHSYALLCDEGYIEARQRSGFYVIYRSEDFRGSGSKQKKTPSRAEADETHASGEGELYSESFPVTTLAKVMRSVLSDKGTQILRKPPNRGCRELREAIAAYLDRAVGIRTDAMNIVIGSGAEYLYSLTAQLFDGHIFAVEEPSYEKIAQVYGACGIELERLKLGADGINSAQLSKSRADILHVTPFNSFPSGVTAMAAKRAEYLRWVDERGGYIIEDNYDSELTVSKKHEDTLFSMSDGCVIYLNTFSRTIAPSVRVGYMVLPDALSDVFEERLGFYSCTVPAFDQYVIAELISSGEFERHCSRVRRRRRKENAPFKNFN